MRTNPLAHKEGCPCLEFAVGDALCSLDCTQCTCRLAPAAKEDRIPEEPTVEIRGDPHGNYGGIFHIKPVASLQEPEGARSDFGSVTFAEVEGSIKRIQGLGNDLEAHASIMCELENLLWRVRKLRSQESK